MKRLVVLAGLVTLLACNQQPANTYPPQYELNFMRACQAQNPAEGLCVCTWAKIEREIAPDEFAAFEGLPLNEQASHPLRGQIERYAMECLNETQPAPEDPPAP